MHISQAARNLITAHPPFQRLRGIRLQDRLILFAPVERTGTISVPEPMEAGRRQDEERAQPANQVAERAARIEHGERGT
jgi:hypothetical protein